MKRILVTFIFIFFFSSNTECQSPGIKISSYDIQASFFKSSSAINISLICNFRNEDNSDSMLVIFNDKCSINSIKLEKANKWQTVHYRFIGKDSLSVKLNENSEITKNQKLKFVYSFPSGEFNDTVFITGRGDRWYPLIMDQIVPFDLKCKVPKGMKVLSAGNLIDKKIQGDTDLYFWKSEPVFKLPLIIFNPLRYKESKLESENNKVIFYTFPEDTIDTSSIMQQTAEAIDYFSSILGKYPYKYITLFEVDNFNGVDIGSGLLMVGKQSLKALQKGYTDLLLMPLAAQWFGAGVFAKYIEPGFFFLNISLPHYLRLMYIRHSQGVEAFNKALLDPLKKYEEFAGKENDLPVIDVDFPNTGEKGLLIYAKAPYILSIIETELGSVTWLDFISDLYNSYRGKILTYEKFKETLSHYDKNGKILISFNKMMSGKGLP